MHSFKGHLLIFLSIWRQKEMQGIHWGDSFGFSKAEEGASVVVLLTTKELTVILDQVFYSVGRESYK